MICKNNKRIREIESKSIPVSPALTFELDDSQHSEIVDFHDHRAKQIDHANQHDTIGVPVDRGDVSPPLV